MYRNLSSVILLYYWMNSYTLFISFSSYCSIFNLVKCFSLYIRLNFQHSVHSNQGPCQKTSCMIGVIRTLHIQVVGSYARANDSMRSDSGELEGIDANILASCWDSSNGVEIWILKGLRIKIIGVKVKHVIKFWWSQSFRSIGHSFVFLFPPMPPVGCEFMVNDFKFVGGFEELRILSR